MSERSLSACEGKVRFETYAHANEVAKLRRDRARRMPYHCPICHGYHIGAARKRVRRREGRPMEEVL